MIHIMCVCNSYACTFFMQRVRKILPDWKAGKEICLVTVGVTIMIYE